MIWTPISMAILGIDALALVLVLAASKTAMDVLVGWDPGAASRRQLALEVASETASIQARAGTALLFLSTLMFLVAICNVFPKIVPGAMCGTGVMNAAGGWGGRALFFRLVALGLLLLWREMEKIDSVRPDSPLALVDSRLLPVALPPLSLSFHATFRAFSGMDIQQPVDCCAVVYDAVRPAGESSAFARVPGEFWVAACLGGAILLITIGLWLWKRKALPSRRATAVIALLCLGWAVAASIALVRVLAAYYYQVLNHHCPWCLFLKEHNLAGYPLFGSLFFAVFESTVAFAASATGRLYPTVKGPCVARIAAAGLRMAAAIAFFVLLSGLPAISWRLKYGVWMGY